MEERDLRYIDITKYEDKSYLDTLLNGWINEDEQEHQKMIPSWDKYDRYYDDQMTPQGLRDDAYQVIKENNLESDKLLVDVNDSLFVPVNEIRRIIDGGVGEFTSTKKETKVYANDPRDTNSIDIVKKVIMDIERSQSLWKRVRRPNIKEMFISGIAWTYIHYNSKVNYPLGNIEISSENCRNVMVQKGSKEMYFQDSTRFTRIIRMPIAKAKRYVKRMGINENRIGADNEANSKYGIRENNEIQQEYVTFYEVFYKAEYPVYFKFNEAGGKMEISNEDDYDIENEEEYHFRAIYHKGLGTIQNGPNKYGRPWVIPYYNIQSKRNLYPNGDCYYLWRLIQLLNILMTLLVDNLRRQNKEIIGISEITYDKYLTQLIDAYNNGGFVPIKEGSVGLQEIKRNDISDKVAKIVPLISKYIDEAGNRTELSEGQMPSDYLSTRTVNNLLEQYRRKFTYKDENIEYAVELENELIYKIIATEFTPAHWIRLEDVKPGSQEFVPINQIYTLEQYEQYIQENKINIDIFEEENHVHYILPNIALPEQVSRMLTLVVINPLDDSIDMTMEVKFDFDAKRDSIEKAQRGQLMRQAGLMPDDQYMIDVGGYSQAEANEMLKKVYGQNQALQLAQEITKRGPEFMQQVGMMLKQYDTMQQQMKATGGAQQQIIQENQQQK